MMGESTLIGMALKYLKTLQYEVSGSEAQGLLKQVTDFVMSVDKNSFEEVQANQAMIDFPQEGANLHEIHVKNVGIVQRSMTYTWMHGLRQILQELDLGSYYDVLDKFETPLHESVRRIIDEN